MEQVSYDQSTPRGMVRQFISFTIGAEEYGIDIMAIREIKGWSPTTPLPNTPEYVRGVINLRGAIVPILDLRARFGEGLTETSPRHVVIVAALREKVLGVLVDAVADIITVSSNEIQPIPEMDRGDQSAMLSGIVSVEGRMVALLDLDQIDDVHLDASGRAA